MQANDGRFDGSLMKRPGKPYPGFPLYADASGQWAKTIRGETHDLGCWDNYQTAFAKYLEQRDILQAGLPILPEGEGLAERIFTVTLEGKPALKDLDIVKAAGGTRKHLVRELKNVEVQGPLELSFSASTGAPLVCGAEVIAR